MAPAFEKSEAGAEHASADEADAGLNGHLRSPALVEAEREIAAMKAHVDNLAAVGHAELDAMMRIGHERLASAESSAPDGAMTYSALECFAACYVMARTLEHPPGELDALSAAALCYRKLGRPEVAIVMLRACIDLSAKHDDVQGHAHALGNTALVLRSLGRLDEAIALQRESVRLAMGCGDWECAVRARVNLANILLSLAASAGAPAATLASGEDSDAAASQRSPRCARKTEAEAQLRAALSVLNERRALGAASSEKDAQCAGSERSNGKEAAAVAELELNVCTRLAASLELASEARLEVSALYARALTCAELLVDEEYGAVSDDCRAHYVRLAETVRKKLEDFT